MWDSKPVPIIISINGHGFESHIICASLASPSAAAGGGDGAQGRISTWNGAGAGVIAHLVGRWRGAQHAGPCGGGLRGLCSSAAAPAAVPASPFSPAAL